MLSEIFYRILHDYNYVRRIYISYNKILILMYILSLIHIFNMLHSRVMETFPTFLALQLEILEIYSQIVDCDCKFFSAMLERIHVI